MAETTAYVAHAREVDTEIAAMWDLYWEAMKPVAVAQKAAAEVRKTMKRRSTNYFGGRDRKAEFEASSDYTYYQQKLDEYAAAEEATRAAAQPLAQAAREYDAEHYQGWQRFFLVDHIHSSQHCSSFRPTTRVGWLPDVSGLTEAEAVAEYGAVMCTICFPSAPVEWTSGQLKVAGVCPGSGTSIYDVSEKRTGYYSGNYAECPECGKYVGMSSKALKIPKHKPTVED